MKILKLQQPRTLLVQFHLLPHLLLTFFFMCILVAPKFQMIYFPCLFCQFGSFKKSFTPFNLTFLLMCILLPPKFGKKCAFFAHYLCLNHFIFFQPIHELTMNEIDCNIQLTTKGFFNTLYLEKLNHLANHSTKRKTIQQLSLLHCAKIRS